MTRGDVKRQACVGVRVRRFGRLASCTSSLSLGRPSLTSGFVVLVLIGLCGLEVWNGVCCVVGGPIKEGWES